VSGFDLSAIEPVFLAVERAGLDFILSYPALTVSAENNGDILADQRGLFNKIPPQMR
jgi:hypothetical protein